MIIFGITIALASCYQPSSQSHGQAHNRQPAKTITPMDSEAQALSAQDGETEIQPATGNAPTMSKYVFQRGQSIQGIQPLAAAQSLNANQHCFHKAGVNSWLSIQLNLDDQQKLIGESTGTVHHPQKGETPYRQTIAGNLTGTQARVEVTTYLGGVTRQREEVWEIGSAQLDMGRVVIDAVPCGEVAADF